MEEAPENCKESSHSAHANGMNERIIWFVISYLEDTLYYELGHPICYESKYWETQKGSSPVAIKAYPHATEILRRKPAHFYCHNRNVVIWKLSVSTRVIVAYQSV
jgi:hypothetical protein